MDKLTSKQQDKKLKIITAAIKAYTEYGISYTTTRQIASVANIGKSTIYEYFKSKEDLDREVIQYLIFMQSKSKVTIREIALTNPVKALNMLIDNSISLSLNSPEILLLISQFTMDILMKGKKYSDVKDEYKKRMEPLFNSFVEEFKMIINRGIQNGYFMPKINDPEKILYIVGALLREIQAQAFIKEYSELKRACELIKETIYEIVGLFSKQENRDGNGD